MLDGFFGVVIDVNQRRIDADFLAHGQRAQRAFELVVVRRVDDERDIEFLGQFDLLGENFLFVGRDVVEADFADADRRGALQKRDHAFGDFARQFDILGFLRIHADGAEMFHAVFGGAILRLPFADVVEVVVKTAGVLAVVHGTLHWTRIGIIEFEQIITFFYCIGFFYLLGGVFLLHTFQSTSAIARERENNTLDFLLLLPQDRHEILFWKWLAPWMRNRVMIGAMIAMPMLGMLSGMFSLQTGLLLLLLPWPAWFDVSSTIKVEISANKSPVKSLDFTTLRIKDAVCDKFREQIGSRPSVATREPDVRIHAHLEEKDGLREHTGAAPLKKNLAAGIIALSGWKPDEAFLDPMCGSGTFLIEAAQIALNIAPGNDGKNRHFAFEKLKNFDVAAWKKMVADARAAEKPKTLLPIYGSDLYGYALDDARANLIANDLADCVRIKQANILEISAPDTSGVLITNPPYGERLGETSDLAELYPKLGDVLKQKFAGWRAYFFTGDTALPKGVRLSASKKTPLFNGKLECRLYEYKIIAGSNRKEVKV